MKLGPLTKLAREDNAKKLTITSCRLIATTLSFFRFTANLEQSRTQIPDAQSVKLPFPLAVTFYLKKIENNSKISNLRQEF